MKASPLKSSFNAGEISPLLYGRVDIAKYQNGCKTLCNFIPVVQGGAKRRPGTRYAGAVKDSTQRTWLAKFEFNTSQAYVLEFGHQYVRFWANHGQLLASASVPVEVATPWTAADLTTTDGTFALDMVQSADVLYIVHPNYAPQKLQRYSNTDWRLSAIDFKNGPFKTQNTDKSLKISVSVGGGASIITGTVTLQATSAVFTPAMVGVLLRLEPEDGSSIKPWTAGQEIVHGGENPFGLLRRSDGKTYSCATNVTVGSGWTIQCGGDMPIHTYGTQCDGSGKYVQGTVVQQQGVDWTYLDSGWGYVRITGYTSSTQVTALVIDSLPGSLATQPSFRWSLGAFNPTDGYPSAVTFFRERLTFAAGQRLYLSVAGDFENFATYDDSGNVVADRAIQSTVASDQVNEIQWLAPHTALLIGTAGGEFVCRENSASEAFGAGNVKIEQQNTDGSRPGVRPARVGVATLFLQRSGKYVKELTYSLANNSFKSADLTVLSEHIAQPEGILQMAWHKVPYAVLWCVKGDGQLLGFTYNPEQEVMAWHRHKIGDGLLRVESVAVIPSPDKLQDELWLIVNTGSSRMMLYLTAEPPPGTATADMFYVDAGLTYSGAPTNTVTGLDHLQAVTDTVVQLGPIGILANGGVVSAKLNLNFPPFPVSVTLPYAASTVHVGLAYTSDLIPTAFEAGAADGTSQGKIRRTNRVSLRLKDTVGGAWRAAGQGSAAPTFTALALPWSGSVENGTETARRMDAATPPFSGTVALDWDGGYVIDDSIWLRQADPLPMTLLSIFPQFTVYDR